MLTLGIVGCGKAATRHAAGLMKMGDWVKIIACCDIDSVSMMDFKKRFAADADVFTDLQFMLDSVKLDAVLLASWPVSHKQQIEACINAGIKNIMVEKPLTISAAEAYEVFTMVNNAGTHIVESNAYMFQPRFAEIDQQILRGDIPPASTIHATFCQADPEERDPTEMDLDWRQCKLHGGGVPWEFVSFMITACNHFAGDLPVGVYAYGSRGRYDTITRMHGMIEYLQGSVAFIHADKQLNCQELSLRHGQTSIKLPGNCWYYDANAPSSISFDDGSGRTHDTLPATDTFLKQWTGFIDSAETDARTDVPFIHSVVTMFTLDALVSSVLQQTSIELDIPEDVMQAYEATLERD